MASLQLFQIIYFSSINSMSDITRSNTAFFAYAAVCRSNLYKGIGGVYQGLGEGLRLGVKHCHINFLNKKIMITLDQGLGAAHEY